MNDDIAVAMFCGPHDEGTQTPMRRIDKAVELALVYQATLFVAGDAFNGDEISFFQMHALKRGVTRVIPAYDSRSNTLGDAQAVARCIRQRSTLEGLRKIYLVTDWWHLERAKAMLIGELRKNLILGIQVVGIGVTQGPHPGNEVLENELQGLTDYLAGNYGQRRVHDPLPHVSSNDKHLD